MHAELGEHLAGEHDAVLGEHGDGDRPHSDEDGGDDRADGGPWRGIRVRGWGHGRNMRRNTLPVTVWEHSRTVPWRDA
ncbi:hypothetical protein Cci01nite_68120 [Catellatospora citrea]|uniref:Uncharacterized protein n=1 Tax=Catellatospora citrea TaxID=53366 RepID=A0A8J3KQT6_9ACTN|nr:hypothetical protein Cci01nite_68120 [Catellatospora citrea]